MTIIYSSSAQCVMASRSDEIALSRDQETTTGQHERGCRTITKSYSRLDVSKPFTTGTPEPSAVPTSRRRRRLAVRRWRTRVVGADDRLCCGCRRGSESRPPQHRPGRGGRRLRAVNRGSIGSQARMSAKFRSEEKRNL